MSSLAGHLWTVGPVLGQRLRPPQIAAGEPWRLGLVDPDVGEVELTGQLHRVAGSRGLVVVVHGLGGCIESRYMIHAAREATARGVSCLRLNMRGADRGGSDLHHAGLSSDLAAVLACPELADYDDLFVAGFSLGGHLALHLATSDSDPRLKAVSATCSPLDLSYSVAAFDQPQRVLYRRYVLAGLVDVYRAIAARRSLPVSVERMRQVRKLREWDELSVVPRFGFKSTADYYARSSVAGRLEQLKVRALLVLSEGDPMVPAEALRPVLVGQPPPRLEVRWTTRGGHVGFPASLDLGLGPRPGIYGQVFSWLLDRDLRPGNLQQDT